MQAVSSDKFSETGAAPRLMAAGAKAPKRKSAGAASMERAATGGGSGGHAAVEAEPGSAVAEPAIEVMARRATNAQAAVEVDASSPGRKRRSAWNEFVLRRWDAAKAELLAGQEPSTKVSTASITKLLARRWADLKQSDSPEAKEEVERMGRLAREGANPEELLEPI